MDVITEIEILETDVKDCNEKCQKVNCSAIYDADAIMPSFKLLCQRVNCSAIYDAIISSFKLLYDLIFMCQKERLIECYYKVI